MNKLEVLGLIIIFVCLMLTCWNIEQDGRLNTSEQRIMVDTLQDSLYVDGMTRGFIMGLDHFPNGYDTIKWQELDKDSLRLALWNCMKEAKDYDN